MARYAAEVNRTAGAGLTVGSVVADGTTPHRGKLYDLVMGSEATPADNAFNWIVGRVTAAGTSTAVTAIALDPADAAALADVGENHTVEPTYTANQTLLQYQPEPARDVPVGRVSGGRVGLSGDGGEWPGRGRPPRRRRWSCRPRSTSTSNKRFGTCVDHGLRDVG